MPIQSSTNQLRSLVKRLKRFHEVDVTELPLDFNAEVYLELNPDLAESGLNPFWHYITVGKQERRPYKPELLPAHKGKRQPLPLDFDPEEYRRIHPDLEHFTGSLEDHFLDYGIFEHRRYRNDRPPAVPALEGYENVPKDFDPDVYHLLNADLGGVRRRAYEHYARFGYRENRRYRFPDVIACLGQEHVPGKPTVLLVSHEATRTGAPILTWNIARQLADTHNIVVLQLGGGAILSNFQLGAQATYLIPDAKHNQEIAEHVIEKIAARHDIGFAILNSIETGIVCKPLTLAGIPSALLIHEFAANTMPRDKFLSAKIWASWPVFSTELTKADAVACFPGLFEDAQVMPQGQCLVPPVVQLQPDSAFRSDVVQKAACEVVGTDAKLVIGIGSVCIRKGVDLFIEVAARMRELASHEALRFLWVGGGYPDYDPEYSAFLKDQIHRSGLEQCLDIVPETDDLDALYEKASLLVLSSRLDPLPNIAIDAICKGLPLVCFDRASGIADVLKQRGLEECCVAKYIDTSDMAQRAVRLLQPEADRSVRMSLKAVGQGAFSMQAYCTQLLGLQQEAGDHLATVTSTVKALRDSGRFDPSYYKGRPLPVNDADRVANNLCWEYVLSTRVGAVIRKPEPGFNPLALRERLALAPSVDPLLYTIEHPHETHRQQPELITPALTLTESGVADGHVAMPRVALHVHAYYPDMLSDILVRLGPNECVPDIYITVDSPAKEQAVRKVLEEMVLPQAQVSLQPNVGRDVYPFLALCETLVDRYDLIGHVHTKKSPHVTDGSDLVERWRELLLGNLLGSAHEERMVDRIVAHFCAHPETQIVFPDDPHVMGWGKNLAMAQQLVSPEEFASLPKQFDFPVGTMFWARSAYMSRFVDMNIPGRFTPEEPLPIDGTELHALERLLGAEVSRGDLRYALTYVPGLNR